MSEQTIRFKARFSKKEIAARHLDNLLFQWSGVDEDGNHIMFNDLAQAIEDGGSMFIEWNGRRYPAYDFLNCNHLDGEIGMDYVRVI